MSKFTKENIKHGIGEMAETLFGVTNGELVETDTFKDQGMMEPDALIMLFMIEHKFDVTLDDTGFNQLATPDNPKLWRNRPVSELVEYVAGALV